MNDGLFWVCVTVAVILFWGEPSLMDALKEYLLSQGCTP